MTQAPRFVVRDIVLHERPVRLRLPFRFGVVTLTECPQAFVHARIELADGHSAWGGAAELMAPKWFDKNLALTNDDNFDQLRDVLRLASTAYRSDATPDTAFGHFARHHDAHQAACAARGHNPLLASYGPALIDRAVLDALCRALGVSFYAVVRDNIVGLGPRHVQFARFDWGAFLQTLAPSAAIDARHTVGLVDAITASDLEHPVADGLPETLEQVAARYGHRYFKLKVGGRIEQDVTRLRAIAAVLDRSDAGYFVSLDGNEQYEDMAGVADLWSKMKAEPRLKRMVESIIFIEQPVKRQKALERKIAGIDKPVIIDESDDSLDAFPRAKALGYKGVSSKTCKGIYKSLINRARCDTWGKDYFMSGEDLTIQPGLALQQDLALVTLLGLTHLERNGHHYVNGMAGLSQREQDAFLAAHPDLYERSHGAVRVRIANGDLSIASLACKGYASAAMPDWDSMRRVQ